MIVLQKILDWVLHPRFLQIMQARLSRVDWAVAGFQKTGVLLVGWIDPKYFPAEDSDDFGLYYVCLHLVQWFDMTGREAILTVQTGFLVVALIFCVAGVFLLLKRRRGA